MASARIARQFAALGGDARLRMAGEGAAAKPLVTDNGQHILDVHGLSISEPEDFEREVNQWPGVVTVGLFALRRADMALIGGAGGVEALRLTER